MLSSAGIKFVRKAGGVPLSRDGEMLPHSVKPLGPWNTKHQKASQDA